MKRSVGEDRKKMFQTQVSPMHSRKREESPLDKGTQEDLQKSYTNIIPFLNSSISFDKCLSKKSTPKSQLKHKIIQFQENHTSFKE